MTRAGTKPKSLTTDLGPEFLGSFQVALQRMGVEVAQKRKEDINAIATLDTAIGQLKKALVSDT